MENKFKKDNLLEIFYNSQEEKIDKIIKNSNVELKEKLNDINIEDFLEKNNDTELKELFEKLEENNSIKISYLNKKMYEQGFIDAFNLIIECLQDKN